MEDNPFKPYHLANVFSGPRYCDRVWRVKFSPDGLLFVVDSDHTARTYSLSPPIPTFYKEFKGHTGRITDLAFSSDSRFLATSSYDSTIRLWDVSKGSLVKTLPGHSNIVSCVKFNRQSNKIASGSSDETVRLWDVDTGACVDIILAFSGLVTALDFSQDGSKIVACSRGGICRIWDTATGKCGKPIMNEEHVPVGSVKFFSDGKFVLVGSADSTLRLWSMDCGMFHRTYVGHVNKSCIISSTFLGPDEKYIISGSEDGCPCIWEAVSGRMVQKLIAHKTPVESVSYQPTRNMIASAAFDDIDTLKIWTQDYWLATIHSSINTSKMTKNLIRCMNI